MIVKKTRASSLLPRLDQRPLEPIGTRSESRNHHSPEPRFTKIMILRRFCHSSIGIHSSRPGRLGASIQTGPTQRSSRTRMSARKPKSFTMLPRRCSRRSSTVNSSRPEPFLVSILATQTVTILKFMMKMMVKLSRALTLPSDNSSTKIKTTSWP